MFKIIPTLLAIFLCLSANARLIQSPYNFSFGFMLAPGNNGIAMKSFLSPKHSLEGVAYVVNSSYEGYEFAGYYNFSMPFDKNDQEMRYGIGAGAHLGFWDEPDNRITVAGPDLQIGIEYTMQRAPFAFSFDWHPSYDVVGRKQLNNLRFGITARFVFK